MANNEIVGPGQAAQVTVVGGGQQYRPSVNYSMPVMQPRQRLNTPDVNVSGGSFNLDLSPIANAMVRSSELEAKQAEKQAEQQLEGIYSSYAQDVNDIAKQHELGYITSDAANARIRKRTDSILSMPGVDADKVKTLKAGFGGFSEDLLKSKATAEQNDAIAFRDKQITSLSERPEFSDLPYNVLARIVDYDDVTSANITALKKAKQTAVSEDERKAIQSQIDFIATGQADAIALKELKAVLVNMDAGAEINEQAYQEIQNKIVTSLADKMSIQAAQRTAYMTMKKYIGGNLHIAKSLNTKNREAYVKEVNDVMQARMTLGKANIFNSLNEDVVDMIARTQLLKDAGVPDVYYDNPYSIDVFGGVVAAVMKGVDGNSYSMPQPGEYVAFDNNVLSAAAKLAGNPANQKYSAGSVLPFAAVTVSAVRDKLMDDPSGNYQLGEEFNKYSRQAIQNTTNRITVGKEQQVLWDNESTSLVAEGINKCLEDINACQVAGKLDIDSGGKFKRSADFLRGSIATNYLRYDEKTGLIGMVADHDLEVAASQGEGAVISTLKTLVESGLNGIIRLGKAATGNEIQENVDYVNRTLMQIPRDQRKKALDVMLHRDVQVLDFDETMHTTNNWFSSFVESLGGALDNFSNYINTREKSDSVFGVNKEDINFNKQEPQKSSNNTGIFESAVNAAGETMGDVAGELFGVKEAAASEIENAPASVDVITAPKTEFEKYVNKKRELVKLRKDMGDMELTKEVAETDKLLADLKHPDSDIVPGINGNISIRDREAIDLGNGEHGTELSITVEADGKHFVIPTIYKDKDGVTRQHTDEEAKEHFRSTGEFLHVEDDPKKAELMAFRIHDRERGGDVLKPYPEKFKPAIVVASNAAGIDIEDIRGKTFAETSDGKQFADSENVGWFQVGDAAAEDVMKDTKYVKKVKEIYPEFKGDKNNPIDNIFLGVGYMKKQEEEARRLFKKYNVPEDTLLEYAFVRYTANQKKLDKLLEKYGEDWIKDEHLISITKNKDNRYVNYIKNYRKAKEAAMKGEIVKR